MSIGLLLTFGLTSCGDATSSSSNDKSSSSPDPISSSTTSSSEESTSSSVVENIKMTEQEWNTYLNDLKDVNGKLGHLKANMNNTINVIETMPQTQSDITTTTTISKNVLTDVSKHVYHTGIIMNGPLFSMTQSDYLVYVNTTSYEHYSYDTSTKVWSKNVETFAVSEVSESDFYQDATMLNFFYELNYNDINYDTTTKLYSGRVTNNSISSIPATSLLYGFNFENGDIEHLRLSFYSDEYKYNENQEISCEYYITYTFNCGDRIILPTVAETNTNE